VPGALEYRARKRARLPVPPTAAEWTSQWPGLLLGRRRARAQDFLQLGDPRDVVSVDFVGPSARTGGAPGGTGTDAGVQPLQRTFAFAGLYDTGAKLFDEVTALVPIESLRTMLGHHALDDRSIDIVTDVAIRATPGLDEEQLQALAAALLPKVRAALPPGARPEVLTWREQNRVYLDAVEHERAMTSAVLFAVMLIAGFLIFATLHVMVTQKTKDIGILTALGGTPSGVGAIFTHCGMVVGALGCTFGTLAGLVSLVWLNPLNDWMAATFGVELFDRTLFDLPQIPYRIEPDWILLVVLAAFLLTLLVAWLPARKAAYLDPVQALAFE
jgi:lipoprotein-releasing system permease protein